MKATLVRNGFGRRILLLLIVCQGLSCSPPRDGADGRMPRAPGDTGGMSAPVRAAQGEFAKGLAAQNHGQWRAACDAFRLADQTFASMGGHDQERVEALLRWADSQLQGGWVREAQPQLATARRLARESNDLQGLVLAINAEGVLLTYAGRNELAEEELSQARDLAESLRMPELTSVVLNNLGNLHRASGDLSAAGLDYQAAADLLIGPADRGLAARVAVNAAEIACIRRSDDAADRLQRAMAATLAESSSHAKAINLLSLGRAAERLTIASPDLPNAPVVLNLRDPQLTFAQSVFDAALKIGQASGDAVVASHALGELGHLRELAHDDVAALHLTHKAEFAAASVGPHLLYRWQWQAGRILAREGDIDGALAAYRNAAATLAPIRSDLILGYGNLRDRSEEHTFRQSVAPLLFELSGLILRKSAALSGPEAQAALVEARQTVEQLKSSEIQDYFKDDCAVTARAVAKDIGTLDPRTAVIYFIPLADHLEILVQNGDGITRHTSLVGSDELSETVHRYREELEDRTQYAYLSRSQQLYGWLIGPVMEELVASKIDTLVFVPDGALLSVPMASLFDGKDYLIEHFAIAITPGLTLMDPRPIQRGDARVLAGGLSLSRSGFSALPNVPGELAQVEKIYGGSALLDQTFIGSRLELEIQSYPFTIIHLASHAEFLGQSSKSFLLTYDGRLSLDDLQRLIAPTAVRSHGRLRPIELLTLSACQTASGDDRAALGLAGVALKAGARSVLATLWSVNDEAQGSLVADVYSRLRDDRTLSKAKALRHAQLKLLKRYPHAFYWSAHVLIGNWL